MEIKICTPELNRFIRAKVKYRLKGSNCDTFGVIQEVFKRQVNINGDWVPFDRFSKIEST